MKNILTAVLIAITFSLSANAQTKPASKKAECSIAKCTSKKSCTEAEKAKCASAKACSKSCAPKKGTKS